MKSEMEWRRRMARFKRGVLGMIVGDLSVRPGKSNYEIVGRDSVGRDVVITRRKVLALAVADGAAAAQMLADMKGVVIRLESPQESFGEFSPQFPA